MTWKARPSRSPNCVIAESFRGVCVGAHRAQPDRAFQHGCGFVFVDKSQLIAFDPLALCFEIGHLTCDQSLAPGRDRKLAQQN